MGWAVQLLRVLYPEDEALVQACFQLVKGSIWPDWQTGYGAFVRCAKKGAGLGSQGEVS